MKKIAAVLLAALLGILSVSAMAEPAGLAGGWTVCEDTTVTEEAAAALESARAMAVGSMVEPVAQLATQVVAGVNYCLLCYTAPFVPEPQGHLVLAYVFHGVNGTDEVLGYTDLTSPDPETAGGWLSAQDCTVTQELLDTMFEAMDFDGLSITPVAVLATKNEEDAFSTCVLCKTAPVIEEPVESYSLVTVSVPADGGAPEITSIVGIELGL